MYFLGEREMILFNPLPSYINIVLVVKLLLVVRDRIHANRKLKKENIWLTKSFVLNRD